MSEKESVHTVQVHRRCCINGRWGYPSDTKGPQWLTGYEMTLPYISQELDRPVADKELNTWRYDFVPDDKKLHGAEQDGAMGTVTIVFSLKG